MSELSSLQLLAKIMPLEELDAAIGKSRRAHKNIQERIKTQSDVEVMSQCKLRRMQIFGKILPTPKKQLNREQVDQHKQKQRKREKSPFGGEFSPIKKKEPIKVVDKSPIKSSNNQYHKLTEKINALNEKMKRLAGEKEKEQNSPKTTNTGVVKKEGGLQVSKRYSTTQSVSEESLTSYISKVSEDDDLENFPSNPYFVEESTYYVAELVKSYRDKKSKARSHLESSLSYLSYINEKSEEREEIPPWKKIKFPRRKGYENKKTIIFDLDETLIHCKDDPKSQSDVLLTIPFPNGKSSKAAINVRPYAKQILESLSKDFEIMVFTASHSCYANVIIDFLDPEGKFVHHRLYREHCIPFCGMNVKDLSMIDRDLSKMVLIDNAAFSYGFQISNGVPIIPYFQGKDDYQLQALEKYLRSLSSVADVRVENRRTFKLERYLHYTKKDVNRLVEDLYQSSLALID